MSRIVLLACCLVLVLSLGSFAFGCVNSTVGSVSKSQGTTNGNCIRQLEIQSIWQFTAVIILAVSLVDIFVLYSIQYTLLGNANLKPDNLKARPIAPPPRFF